MVVTPSLPVKTVQDFIDYAKAHPGQISFASSGVGASPHLSGAYFKALTKIDVVHVPYRGSAAAYPDLMSGKVHVLFDNLGGPVLQMVRAGQLRALAVTSAQRWPLLSDLPTVAETVPGYEVNVWYAMFAPKGTPRDIVMRLNQGLKQAIAEPAIKERFAQDGGMTTSMTPEDLAKFMADDEANWHKMVEAAGIAAE
jgi:tripartite-type tricarboxylate transporter receptor subunit TctC